MNAEEEIALLLLLMVSQTATIVRCLQHYLSLVRRLRRIRSRRATVLRRYLRSQKVQGVRHVMRRSAVQSSFMTLLQGQPLRRWWVYPRPSVWWNEFVLTIWDDEHWLRDFRVTRETFMWLANCLGPRLQHQTTNMRRPISPEERLAITLWWLADTSGFSRVSNQFGVARSTVCGIVAEVCAAMVDGLLSQIIRLDSVGRAMTGFGAMGFPHCFGAVDGCHVQILGPPNRAAEYINRKNTFSIVLQGAVDDRGRFFDINVGQSGRNHDAHIFRCSNLCKAMDAGVFVPGNPTVTLEGERVPPLILADAAYPMRRWLITPFTGNLTPDQAAFNRVHSRARNTVERAFGRLKARWRCLSQRVHLMIDNVITVVTACCILHNICEDRGHHLPVDEAPSLPVILGDREPQGRAVDRRNVREGEKVRAAVMAWILRRR